MLLMLDAAQTIRCDTDHETHACIAIGMCLFVSGNMCTSCDPNCSFCCPGSDDIALDVESTGINHRALLLCNFDQSLLRACAMAASMASVICITCTWDLWDPGLFAIHPYSAVRHWTELGINT